MSCNKSFGRKFKAFDRFGQRVNLTYNGKVQYKTTLGALMSFLLLVVIIGYMSYRLNYMVNRYNPTVSKSTLIKKEDFDVPFRPQDYGFSFAFGLKNATLDPSYGYYTVNYVSQIIVNQTRLRTRQELSYSECGDKHFTYEDKNESDKYGI